jgi:hypothetical protein
VLIPNRISVAGFLPNKASKVPPLAVRAYLCLPVAGSNHALPPPTVGSDNALSRHVIRYLLGLPNFTPSQLAFGYIWPSPPPALSIPTPNPCNNKKSKSLGDRVYNVLKVGLGVICDILCKFVNKKIQKHETKPHVEVNLDSIVDFDFCDLDLDV